MKKISFAVLIAVLLSFATGCYASGSVGTKANVPKTSTAQAVEVDEDEDGDLVAPVSQETARAQSQSGFGGQRIVPVANAVDCRDRSTMLQVTNSSSFDIVVETGTVELYPCSTSSLRVTAIVDARGNTRMSYVIPANSGSIKYFFQVKLPFDPVHPTDGRVAVMFRAYYQRAFANPSMPEVPTNGYWEETWRFPRDGVAWINLTNSRFVRPI